MGVTFHIAIIHTNTLVAPPPNMIACIRVGVATPGSTCRPDPTQHPKNQTRVRQKYLDPTHMTFIKTTNINTILSQPNGSSPYIPPLQTHDPSPLTPLLITQCPKLKGKASTIKIFYFSIFVKKLGWVRLDCKTNFRYYQGGKQAKFRPGFARTKPVVVGQERARNLGVLRQIANFLDGNRLGFRLCMPYDKTY